MKSIRRNAFVSFFRFSGAFCLICVAVASFVSPVQAQTKATKTSLAYVIDQLYPPIPDLQERPYKFRIGMVVGVVPAFEGSSDLRFRYSPLIDVTYRDRIFLNTNRLRFNFMPKGRIRAGFQLKYHSGRKERLTEDLKGLGDVGASLDAGVYIEARIFKGTVISADFSHDIASGHKSWIGKFLLGQGLYQDDNTLIGAGLETHWAGGGYMNTYFGVNAAQSAASGLPIFKAHSGFKDVGLLLYWRQDLTKHISLVTNITFRHMLDSANDSPIVIQRGNPKQFISSFAVRYAF